MGLNKERQGMSCKAFNDTVSVVYNMHNFTPMVN